MGHSVIWVTIIHVRPAHARAVAVRRTMSQTALPVMPVHPMPAPKAGNVRTERVSPASKLVVTISTNVLKTHADRMVASIRH